MWSWSIITPTTYSSALELVVADLVLRPGSSVLGVKAVLILLLVSYSIAQLLVPDRELDRINNGFSTD